MDVVGTLVFAALLLAGIAYAVGVFCRTFERE